ncbi:MAG: zinc-binding dehydrogenase [Fidelibacterota bacterium]
MKGVRIHEFGGPEVLRWEDIPEPHCPSDGVLVRIRAASINHLDLWVRGGISGIALPHVMGSDGSGTILEAGKSVDGWKPGDEVMIQPGTYCGSCRFCREGRENYCQNFGILGRHRNGTQCDILAIEPHYLQKKPPHVSFEEAAAFPLVFLTAYQMLVRRAHTQKGETVLILGGGSGVGSAAIQIARELECRIIATGGDDRKLQLARSLGAHHVLNHYEETIHQRVMKLTDGRGADVVFEHVGEATWPSSLRSLARGGRIVTCGATTGAEVAVNLRHLYWKQQSLLGSTMGDARAFREVARWLEKGKVSPVLDRVFPMTDVPQAHRYVEERHHLGKVVLVPDG